MTELGPLDHDAALLALRSVAESRLFPADMIGRLPALPPAGRWIPRGGERLDVDRVLDTLALRRRLADTTGHDYYLVARRWIVLAVETACRALEQYLRARRSDGPELERRATAATKISTAIDSVFADFPEWDMTISMAHRANFPDYRANNEIERATRAALNTLKAAGDAAEVLRKLANDKRAALIPPHSAGDIWRQSFVAGMCHGWRDLTGKPPTARGVLFAEFVTEGYSSLSGNVGTASRAGDNDEPPYFLAWENIIRTVVMDFRNRPAERGFDRYDHPHTAADDGERIVALKYTRERASVSGRSAFLNGVIEALQKPKK